MSTEDKPSESDKVDKGDTHPAPPHHIPLSSTPAGYPADKKQRFCEKWHYEIEFLAVAAAVFYAIYTYREWRTFDSERQTMENEFRESQASEIVAERAWIFPAGITENVSDDRKSGSFTVTFTNTGRTPALNVEAMNEYADITNSIPPQDKMPATPVNRSVLGPGQAGIIQTPQIPSQVLTNLSASPFYIFGTIWYDDIYGNHHWAQFDYVVKRNPQMTRLLSVSTIPLHNSCDDAVTNKVN